REIDEVAVLEDRRGRAATAPATAAAAAGAAARDRRAGIVVGRILLPIPELAWLRAGFQQPGARAARAAIVFRHERESLVGERHATEAPLGLGELVRLRGERRVERHHLVAERHLILQVAAVERLDPDDGRGLIRPPLMTARSRL